MDFLRGWGGGCWWGRGFVAGYGVAEAVVKRDRGGAVEVGVLDYDG